MKKLKKTLIIMSVVLGIGLAGCKGESGKNVPPETVKENVENIQEDSTQIGVEYEPEDTEEEEYDNEEENISLEITDWVEFSDGYAWVNTNDKWYCINSEGQSIFSISDDHTPGKVINGYCVIDSKYIINLKNEMVYDFCSEGYEMYDYAPLDVGIVILSKEIDEFERSGKFLYTLNLNNKRITEISLENSCYYTKCDYHEWDGNGIGVGIDERAVIDQYFGNGLYTIGEYDELSERVKGDCVYDVFQLYDVTNNQFVDIQIGDSNSYRACGYSILDTNDKYIKYLYYDKSIQRVDLKNHIADKPIADNIAKELDDFWSHKYFVAGCIDEGIFKYATVKRRWYIDLNSNELFSISTEFGDSFEDDISKYDVILHKNGKFVLTMKNDSDSDYLAIIDKTGKTLLSPTKYDMDESFMPQLVGDQLVYYDGAALCMIDMNTIELITNDQIDVDHYQISGKEGSFSNIICLSVDNDGLMMCESDQNIIFYDKKGNEITRVYSEGGLYFPEQENLEPYFMIFNDNEREFWNIRGEKLQIHITD